MANVTDPLARPLHGTNPQNLIEYITRQKIYDSKFWKEECFGLSALDVATKAAQQNPQRLRCVGGSYGGNSKPTRFLCLTLKLLQIQPDGDVVEEFLQNEEFKYVRALGAFYLRLTGRPAEIYEKLEPLYNDYRRLRCRDMNSWEILCMDDFVDLLLREDRVCGIAMPRLPKRHFLEEAGYLEEGRRSALQVDAEGALEMLETMVSDGSEVAKKAVDERRKRLGLSEVEVGEVKDDDRGNEEVPKAEQKTTQVTKSRSRSRSRSWGRSSRKDRSSRSRSPHRHRDERRRGKGDHHRDHDRDDNKRYRRGDDYYRKSGHSKDRGYEMKEDDRNRRGWNRDGDYDREGERYRDSRTDRRRDERRRDHRKGKDFDAEQKTKNTKNYGSLFKDDKPRKKRDDRRRTDTDDDRRRTDTDHVKDTTSKPQAEEGSDEYWNDQRAKLGLKPLKK